MISVGAIAAGGIILLTGLPLMISFASALGILKAVRGVQTLTHRKALATLAAGDAASQQAHDLLKARLTRLGVYNGVSAAALAAIAVGAPLTIVSGGLGLAILLPGVAAVVTADYFQRQDTGYEGQLNAGEKIALDSLAAIIAAVDEANRQYRLLKVLKSERRDVFPWAGTTPLGMFARAARRIRIRHHGAEPTRSAAQIVWHYARARATDRVAYLQTRLDIDAAQVAQSHDAARRAVLQHRGQEHLQAQAAQQQLLTLAAQSADTPLRSFHKLGTWLTGVGLMHAVAKRLQNDPRWRASVTHSEDPAVWARAGQALRRMPAAEQQHAVNVAYEHCEAELLTDEKRRASYRQRELLDFLLAYLETPAPAPAPSPGVRAPARRYVVRPALRAALSPAG